MTHILSTGGHPVLASALLIKSSSAEITTENIIFSAESSANSFSRSVSVVRYTLKILVMRRSGECFTGQDGDAREDFDKSGKEQRRSFPSLR
jgi:hypothetical protein